MSSNKLDNWRSKERRLTASLVELNNAGITTPAQRGEFERISKEILEVREDINMLEATMRALPKTESVVAAPAVNAVTIVRSTDANETHLRNEKRASLNAALRHALRYGRRNTPEQRALSTLSDSSGAALFGETFEEQAEWTRAVANFAPLTGMIHTKFSPTGANRKFVVTDQTEQYMLQVGETSATDSTDTTPTINSEVTGSLASIVGRTTISFQELADVDDLLGYLRDGFAIQAGRAQELAILAGADHASNALESCPTGGLLAVTVAGSPVTNATVNEISPTDLVNLSTSVDYGYFLEGSYLASQAVYGYLSGLLKTTGDYLFPRDDQGNLIINGKKLVVASNAAMATYTASSGTPLMLFGSFKRAWGATITPFRVQILQPSPETLTNQVVASFRMGQVSLIANAVNALVQKS